MNRQRKKYLYESILLLSVLFVVMVSVHAQEPTVEDTPIVEEVVSVNEETPLATEEVVQLVRMIQAYEQFRIREVDAEIFIGNEEVPMIWYHNGAYLFADSAHWRQEYNIFEAFDNVRIVQGDTLFAYANYLHYDGNTSVMRLRYNVRLEDPTATLFTDSLNYDRIANIGYFFEGGMLVDEENTLTAYWGQYSPDTNQALFRDNVRLVNENFVIYADTLIYNTVTTIADIQGPSRIVSEDGIIYTSRGWYNTTTDEAMLLDLSRVYSNDRQTILTGDTIFYNRITGYGEVFGNMELTDWGRQAILRGNYGFYNEITEFGFATNRAYIIDFSQPDSLFIGGDSLFMITINEDYRDFRAFANVRVFHNDMQAISDSLHYSAQDSTIFMRGRPVIFHESSQILGQEIDILLNDSTIERAYIRGGSLAAQQRIETDQFDQLAGHNMTAYFYAGEIYRLHVVGNAETIFYLEEDDGHVIGLNRTDSPYATFYIENQEVVKIILMGPDAGGTTTPLPQLTPEATRLPRFVWLYYLRPLHSRDIFRQNVRHAVDDIEPVPARIAREDRTL